MRRLPLLVALYLLAAMVAASAVRAQKFEIGSTLGVNISSFRFDPPDDAFISGTNPIGGLQAVYNIDPTWALRLQVLYVVRSAQETIDIVEFDLQRKLVQSYTFRYLELPLCAVFRFTTASFRPYVYFGVSMGILLSGLRSSRTGNDPEQYHHYYSTEITTNDYGVMAGAGMQYALHSGLTLFVEAGGSLGLTDVNALEHYPPMYTRDLRLSAGILSALP